MQRDRDGGCKHYCCHVFSLNSRGEDSVTSGSCQWIRKPLSDTGPCVVKRKFHKKTKLTSNKKKKRKYTWLQGIELKKWKRDRAFY